MRIDVHTWLGLDGASSPPAEADAEGTERGPAPPTWHVFVSACPARDHAREINLDEIQANLAVLSATRNNPAAHALYWVRPNRFESRLHTFLGAFQREPFAAAVFAPELDGYDVREHDRISPYLAALGRMSRPAVFRITEHGPASVVETVALVRKHPSATVVLSEAAATDAWGAALSAVARAHQRDEARIYLDTAGARVSEVQAAVRTLGPQWLLFGSGCRWSQEGLEAARRAMSDLESALPADVFQKIAGGNALRVFGLNQPVHTGMEGSKTAM